MKNVSVTFEQHDGTKIVAEGAVGETLLRLAHEAGIDIEGACEGNMACSTCHLIISPEFYSRLPEASEEEEEMLDLASGLRATSRLGCQVELSEDLEGLRVIVPRESKNMMGL